MASCYFDTVTTSSAHEKRVAAVSTSLIHALNGKSTSTWDTPELIACRVIVPEKRAESRLPSAQRPPFQDEPRRLSSMLCHPAKEDKSGSFSTIAATRLRQLLRGPEREPNGRLSDHDIIHSMVLKGPSLVT
ncbi:hypothetical protein ColTof4_13585 [Colletotrichum tofieldiae]|nr:hypothetical protein ColTof3_14534 [Colletotrichum tofieldiae]GKT81162.1 hypothetical protein ColTof4_13585 [Colletotrichum tofieldiae]GKT97326.1 hypothetical protein Ct61P_15176 [Colletotrichum tofieldiae]